MEANLRECTCCAECCRSVTVGILPPETDRDWENLKWMVDHENVNVLLLTPQAAKHEGGEWGVEFLTPCSNLRVQHNGTYECHIYKDRYDICKEQNSEFCVKANEENKLNGKPSANYYQVKFTCAKDVDDYLANKNKLKTVSELTR